MIIRNLSQIFAKYSRVFLFIIFVIALILRWMYLPQNAISFAYDQARDAFVVLEILKGHLKILGPAVSGIHGLFHGVFYYYVIAPAYYFGQGNPVIVAYFLSFISSLGVFVVYFLAHIITKNKLAAFLASLIFAFSFESTQYANLMTNASLAAWFTPIMYIGLFLWIKNKFKWAPVITGIGFGLSIQSEVALAYHLAPIIFWLFVCRKSINRAQIFMFIGSLILSLSTMIVSEIKFGFTGLNGVLYLLSGGDGIAKSRGLGDYFATLITQSGKVFAYTIFPINLFIGALIGYLMIIVSFIKNFKEIKVKILTWETFLISWIFAYALALPFGGSNMKHVLVGVAPAIAIYSAIFIYKYIGKNKFIFSLALLVIVLSNLFMIIKENKNGQTIFPLQEDLVLSKEIEAVEFTYSGSKGEDFSISTLTSPLFVNTLWSYLYNWHGNKKYGYLPSWVGRDQIGQLGNNLQFAPRDVTNHYYIIEPTYGIPELWVTYARGDQDAISTLVERNKFGDILVEQRKVKNVK